MKRKSLFILLLLCSFVATEYVHSHSGGLDSNGGHYNRKTGEYHIHRQKSSDTSTSESHNTSENNSQTQTTLEQTNENLNIISGDRDTRIGEYFRKANENVGALDCNIIIQKRNLLESTKEAVLRRDGNRCVICGSSVKLEVDQRRALENGGSNDISNLATLCDECHLIKTRMDNSLRRNREKKCRGENLPEPPKSKEEPKSPESPEKGYLREITLSDGSKYIGNIVNGRMHGQGTYIWLSGDKYIGEFADNKATGGWFYKTTGRKIWAYQDPEGKWITKEQ